MTAKQQIRWGFLGVYLIFAASAILTFDQSRQAVWAGYAIIALLAAALVALWNKKKPGDDSAHWRIWF
ncbi:hypothetical protein ACFWXK_25015 [Streptomyces sp. NPDC059070]|uniref:hypothetical protein n=1 Tax=Streptomyces sp. NPDC059070 TaxID=3346713 RepID=UPI0036970555